jgi:hypothetical protein
MIQSLSRKLELSRSLSLSFSPLFLFPLFLFPLILSSSSFPSFSPLPLSPLPLLFLFSLFLFLFFLCFSTLFFQIVGLQIVPPVLHIQNPIPAQYAIQDMVYSMVCVLARVLLENGECVNGMLCGVWCVNGMLCGVWYVKWYCLV